MRFLTMIKMREDAGPAPAALREAMGAAIERGFRDGTLVDTGGLSGTADSTLMTVRGGRLQVTDGPFSEAKEVVGGYAFLEVRSREEAVAMATDIAQLHVDHWPGWEGEIEIRQVFGPDLPAPGA